MPPRLAVVLVWVTVALDVSASEGQTIGPSESVAGAGRPRELSAPPSSDPQDCHERTSAWLDSPLLKESPLEEFGQDIARWKTKLPLSFTVGAYHWWHVDNGGPLASGYGVPGVPGTHSYYLFVDGQWPIESAKTTKTGIHLQMRLRDSGVPLRPFFTDDHFWFWEAYGFLDTPLGRLKIGSIYKQFGLFWDDSWWGNVQYFDGLKLDSDYGLSLEHTPDFEDGFKVDRYLQLYLAEDRVNGSIAGADPESFAGSEERNTFIGRFVPTWRSGEEATFALGVSGLVGEVANRPTLQLLATDQVFPSPGDQTIAGWAVDATWTNGRWKLFGEVSQLFGVLTPSHYISGGPSDRYTDGLAGITHTQGPITYRCVYSHGIAANPHGRQGMLVPGITVQITSNLTLWIEYTHWESQSGSPAQTVTLENGYHLIVDWHF